MLYPLSSSPSLLQRLELTPSALAPLRRVLETHLSLWGLADLRDPASLCLTELLGNVLRHCPLDPWVTVRLHTTELGLRIEVFDSVPTLPPPPRTPSTPTLDEHGRGLLLVAACADRHGFTPTLTGKCAWAELDSAHGN